MEVLKQSSQYLVFEVRPLKGATTIVWTTLLLATVCIIVGAMVFDIQEAILFFLPICLLIMMMIELHHTYIIPVDKKEDYIKVEKNAKVIYTSTYPIRHMKEMKTTISKRRFSGGATCIMVILEDNTESVIETYTSSYYGNLWQFDIMANEYAEIARNIAEFLGLPFIEGEYRPPFL